MIGQQVAQYRIVEELGGGGWGLVYRAEDTKLRRDVALKVLKPERAVSKKDRARFLKEARSAAALHHPNICTVYEVGEDDGVSYISMAYIPGESLQDILQRGPIDVDRALDIAIQVGEALQSAHDKKIVHRDIKSANIILSADGRATILDFGIAKLADQATETKEGKVVGTIAYMSPEQATGGKIDHQTDIWSLGVCLYEMISGTRPFTSDHDTAVLYQIVNEEPPRLPKGTGRTPRSVQRVVDKAMKKKQRARYPRVEDMLTDLKQVRENLQKGIDEGEPSIAVLPFTNMSDDEKQDYFCDGMSEEIINCLTQLEGIRVASRTSSFSFHGAREDIRDIGRKLSVDTILEGSVQKAGKRLRITTQLVDVDNGYHLWSESFDRDLEDVFAIQDEIACNVVDALKVKLTENDRRVMEKVPTSDMQAYDYYMRALKHYHAMTYRELEYARNLFTSAIIKDPNYALAYCGLSDCYAMISTFYDKDRSHVDNALTASSKALELDADLAQAHASYGLALSLDGKYDEAEKEFLLAIEMSPKLFEAYYFYARTCRPQGKLEKAAEMFEMASEVRPEDYEAPILAADSYIGLDRPDDMERCYRKGLDAAAKHLEHHPEEARAWYLGAHAHHGSGNTKEAREWNEKAMKMAPRDPATLYNAACLFSLLGEIEKCFESLEKAIDNGFSGRAWLEKDPDLEAIRSDQRYEGLLEALGE